MKWTVKQLAHACDVVVNGIQSGVPFDGNPAFIEAFQVLGGMLRGNSQNIKGIAISSRQDGNWIMFKPADTKPILNLRDE